jgi:hypothetical protein
MFPHRTAAPPLRAIGLALALFITTLATEARADSFSSYTLQSTFALPGANPVFDILPDGRVVVVGMAGTTANVYLETASGSHTFALTGALPSADFSSFGAAFVRASPNGAQVAVGNNGGNSFGNFQVGVFSLPGLSGKWFNANHFDARWIDNRYVAISAGTSSAGIVTALDSTSASTSSPSNVTLVDSIGGASGGIAFDSAGNMFTSDGFKSAGPSVTGEVMAIPSSAWHAALAGGTPVHFETQGIPIVALLSASPIGFDSAGNLVVGGSNSFGSPPDDNYFAIVHAPAVAAALAGGGLINTSDPSKVRKLDPDTSSSTSSYAVGANTVRGELYAVPFGSTTVYDFGAPANAPALPGAAIGALAIGLALVGAMPRRRRTALR